MDITRTFTNANGTSNKGEPNPLPFTPWGQKQWDNYNPVKNGDYAGSCMPFGWLRSFTPHPMQLLHNNEYIAFLFEQSTMFQLVNTEGLPHRTDWPPTWFGDSRGRWEGDTLIIDVVNMNGYAKLGTIGHPMSDQAHLIMTFKRPDMGRLHVQLDARGSEDLHAADQERARVHLVARSRADGVRVHGKQHERAARWRDHAVARDQRRAERRAGRVGMDVVRPDQAAEDHRRRSRKRHGTTPLATAED